ncbi:hypothetical protein BDD12DRAFT_884216 [Trichophaea hybrida]|nr:hypothetical protein BDD12DRAFT_884216 [Trichophaea hybrida]
MTTHQHDNPPTRQPTNTTTHQHDNPPTRQPTNTITHQYDHLADGAITPQGHHLLNNSMSFPLATERSVGQEAVCPPFYVSSMSARLGIIDRRDLQQVQGMNDHYTRAIQPPLRSIAVRSLLCSQYQIPRFSQLSLRVCPQEMKPPIWLAQYIRLSCLINRVWRTGHQGSQQMIIETLIAVILLQVASDTASVEQLQENPPSLLNHVGHGSLSEPLLDIPPKALRQISVRKFSEVSLSYTTTCDAGLPVEINGCCVLGFGYIEESQGRSAQDPFLAILEAESESALEQAFPALLAYMASLHDRRRAANEQDATIFGIVSDGFRYLFVQIDNDSIVGKSRDYDLIDHFDSVYEFIRCIFHVALESL